MQKNVGRTGRKSPKGRVILPSKWIGKSVVVAPSNEYVVVSKEEYSNLKKMNKNLSFVTVSYTHLTLPTTERV